MARTAGRKKGTTRKVRQPGRVDELVWGAVQKIRAAQPEKKELQFSAAQILEQMDQRAMKPTPVSIYRSLERLGDAGRFTATRKGTRGHFTYRFKEDGSSGRTITRSPRTIASAPSVNGKLDSQINTLLEKDRTLTQELNDLMAKLAVQVAAKETEVAAVRAHLEGKGVAVPA